MAGSAHVVRRRAGGWLPRWFHRAVLARRWATFLMLGLGFFVFGACTLNLFFLFRANSSLVLEHGWMALMDGAALQFLELLCTGYTGMAAYLIFKTCEHRLVHWLSGHEGNE